MDTIYSKTAKGLREATGKTRTVPRDLRHLLGVIDGKLSVDALLQKAGHWSEDGLRKALAALVEQGYIRESAPLRAETEELTDLDFTSLRPVAAQEAEAARRETEERATREAAEQVRREAEEQVRRIAKEAARREIRERAKREAAEQAHREAEDRARWQAEEAARRMSEERAKREAAEQARYKAEEAARRLAEEAARREAEERARREAEDRTRRLAEEETARREADERARQEAEERARREAAELAQREAEDRLRRLAEEAAQREAAAAIARQQAEEAAQREAEERARREAAELARREAEAKAQRLEAEAVRREAEERTRHETAEQARHEAEAVAQRQAEEAAQRETEERARREAAEQAHRKAEAKTRNLEEKAAQREADLLAQRQAEEAARRKAEADAQRTAEKRARRAAAKEDARRVAEERAARKAAEHARRAAEAQRQEAAPLPRRRRSAAKAAAIGVLAAAGIGLALLHLVSFDSRIPRFEAAIAARFQQPVKIRSLRFALLPRPHWRIENLAIGAAGQIRAPRVDAFVTPAALFGDQEAFGEIKGVAPELTAEGLGWLLFAAPRAAEPRIGRVGATDAKLEATGIDLPVLDATAEIGADGNWQKMAAASADGKFALELRRQGEAFEVRIEAASFMTSVPGMPALQDFSARGTAGRGGLALTEFQGHAFGGTLNGTARLGWAGAARLDGEVRARLIDVARLLPGLFESGALEGKATFSLPLPGTAAQPAATQLHGNFLIRKGGFATVDLGNVLLRDGGAGRMRFATLEGEVVHDSGKTALRQVRLDAGTLSARGNAAIDADDALRGSFVVELDLGGARQRGEFAVSGGAAARRGEGIAWKRR